MLFAWLMTTLLLLTGCIAQPKSALSSIPDIHVNLGIAYIQQGDFEKARMALNQALLIQPHSPASWDAMAYLEELSGNLLTAAHDYQYAIKLNPEQGESHNNYGIFLCRQHQPLTGIKELLIATQLPSYIYRAAAYENAGLCALTIPDSAAAQEYFAAAERNNPLLKPKKI